MVMVRAKVRIAVTVTVSIVIQKWYKQDYREIVGRGESWELCFRGVDRWKRNKNKGSMSNNIMSVVSPKPIHLLSISCVKPTPLQI